MLTSTEWYRRALLVWLTALLAATAPARPETTLIEFAKSEWRYLDDGSDAGTSWRGLDFDDSSWKRGASPLGYGEALVRTEIDQGSDPERRPITAYFRHTFEVSDPENVKVLSFLVRSDDGFVLYLNGKEGERRNLPREEITYETTATVAMEGRLERDYFRLDLLGPKLRKGKNVVAVEVHQSSPASDDLFLDLHLKSFPAVVPFKRGKMEPGAREAVYAYWKKHYVGPDLRIPDGYVDGGRGMQLDDEGNVTTYREVIVVDRSRDEALRRHLEYARSARVKALPPIERAREIVRYINREIPSEQDPLRAYLAGEIYIAENRAREVLAGRGDYGVCRHRSLLFKMLSDESGLQVALVRGNYRSGEAFGGHAWNELKVADGRTVIVDVTNPAPDLYFPATNRRGAERYLTVRNEPWYIEPESLKPIDIARLRSIMRTPRSESFPRLAADAAEEELTKAIKLYGSRKDSAENRMILAGLCEDLGRSQEARRHVEAALKLEPNDRLAHLALATLIVKADESGDSLRRAYNLIMRGSGSIQETESHYELARQMLALGYILALAGQYDDATQVVEQALQLDEDFADAERALRVLRE